MQSLWILVVCVIYTSLGGHQCLRLRATADSLSQKLPMECISIIFELFTVDEHNLSSIVNLFRVEGVPLQEVYDGIKEPNERLFEIFRFAKSEQRKYLFGPAKISANQSLVAMLFPDEATGPEYSVSVRRLGLSGWTEGNILKISRIITKRPELVESVAWVSSCIYQINLEFLPVFFKTLLPIMTATHLSSLNISPDIIEILLVNTPPDTIQSCTRVAIWLNNISASYELKNTALKRCPEALLTWAGTVPYTPRKNLVLGSIVSNLYALRSKEDIAETLVDILLSAAKYGTSDHLLELDFAKTRPILSSMTLSPVQAEQLAIYISNELLACLGLHSLVFDIFTRHPYLAPKRLWSIEQKYSYWRRSYCTLKSEQDAYIPIETRKAIDPAFILYVLDHSGVMFGFPLNLNQPAGIGKGENLSDICTRFVEHAVDRKGYLFTNVDGQRQVPLTALYETRWNVFVGCWPHILARRVKIDLSAVVDRTILFPCSVIGGLTFIHVDRTEATRTFFESVTTRCNRSGVDFFNTKEFLFLTSPRK